MIHLVVLDTETGGLDRTKHCIIEIAAQYVTIEPEAFVVHAAQRFHCLVVPDRQVDRQAADVNGYSAALWQQRGAEHFGIAGQRFLHWLRLLPGEHIMWAGSNVSGFDLPFLESDLVRHQLGPLPGYPKFSHRVLNTESLCFPLYAKGVIPGCGLKHLRKWAGIEGEQKHTAAADVDDTVSVLRRYLRVACPFAVPASRADSARTTP